VAGALARALADGTGNNNLANFIRQHKQGAYRDIACAALDRELLAQGTPADSSWASEWKSKVLAMALGQPGYPKHLVFRLEQGVKCDSAAYHDLTNAGGLLEQGAESDIAAYGSGWGERKAALYSVVEDFGARYCIDIDSASETPIYACPAIVLKYCIYWGARYGLYGQVATYLLDGTWELFGPGDKVALRSVHRATGKQPDHPEGEGGGTMTKKQVVDILSFKAVLGDFEASFSDRPK
jgi:hypothetical protein